MTVYAAHVSADVMDVASFKNFVKVIETFGSGGLDDIFRAEKGQLQDLKLQANRMLIMRGPLKELTKALNVHKGRQIVGESQLGIYICHADGQYRVVVRELVNRQKFVTVRVSTKSTWDAGLKTLSAEDVIEALELSRELEEGRIEPLVTLKRGFRREPPREPTVAVRKGPIEEKKELKGEKKEEKEEKEVKREPISFACRE